MVNESQIQEWVKLAKRGNTEAFSFLYDQFSQSLFNFLFARLRHKQTAEDLLQTVFLKVWNNLKTYQPKSSAKFSTWLFQIAQYTLIDYWRTKKDTSEIDKVDNLLQFATDPKLYEDYKFLDEAIVKLPGDYQTVLDLRFKQDLTVSETAHVMDKSEVGIRVLQHRALKALKDILIKSGKL